MSVSCPKKKVYNRVDPSLCESQISNDRNRIEIVRPVLVQKNEKPQETQANCTNISANQGNVEYLEPETEDNVSSEILNRKTHQLLSSQTWKNYGMAKLFLIKREIRR
jgi:hypothetical protein